MSLQARRAVWGAVVACGLVVLIGLTVLWPSGAAEFADPLGLSGDPIRAKVTAVERVPCSYDPLLECKLIELTIGDGDLRGEIRSLETPTTSTISDGDTILVDIYELDNGTESISFYDFERSTPMLLLTILFVAAIIVLGRWRGVGALAGLAMSIVMIVVFCLPALLEGTNPVAVALVTAGAIAFIAIFLAHGVTLASASALLSTFASLAVTGLLAWLFVTASNFTGLGDDSIGFLDALGTPIDPRGLLLAGILIGSLGVLDDVTVTQVSAVWELKRAAPHVAFGDLYSRAVNIGRDHISSTVNTLFLAYAGAALPLLLLFSVAGEGVTSVITREIVAIEIVRALVGSIGLVASVPISTALAAGILGSVTHDSHPDDDEAIGDGRAIDDGDPAGPPSGQR